MGSGVSLTAIALMLVAGTASASVTGLPKEITIGETPYDLSFYVQNNNPIRQPLEAEFAFPTKFTVIKKPQWIEGNATTAGKNQNVIVRIFPQEGFEGTSYTSTIKIIAGGDVTEKNVTINYVHEDSCNVEAQIEVQDDESGGNAGMNAAITLTNHSYRPKAITLKEMRGTPPDWKISGSTEFGLGAFEKRTYETSVDGKSNFEGNAEFIFGCRGTEFAGIAKIRHVDKGIPAAVLAIISGASGSVEGEFILDMFLVIIASILLIAFIARMVKLLNNDSQGKQSKEGQK